MATKCGNSTWRSWINSPPVLPPQDGEFDTGAVGAGGAFPGFHRRRGFQTLPVTGACAETPDRITLSRVESVTAHHLYFGKISTVDGKDWVLVGDGRHRFSNTPFADLTEADWDLTTRLAADDDWVAEKVT